jgi:hypothetical protein
MAQQRCAVQAAIRNISAAAPLLLRPYCCLRQVAALPGNLHFHVQEMHADARGNDGVGKQTARNGNLAGCQFQVPCMYRCLGQSSQTAQLGEHVFQRLIKCSGDLCVVYGLAGCTAHSQHPRLHPVKTRHDRRIGGRC